MLKPLIFFLPDLLTPNGVPHELHTNLPDRARSALRSKLPQNKHLLGIINLYSIKNIINK